MNTNMSYQGLFAPIISANQNLNAASKVDLIAPATQDNSVPPAQNAFAPTGGYTITVAPDFDDPIEL